jgi:hypothetical protein
MSPRTKRVAAAVALLLPLLTMAPAVHAAAAAPSVRLRVMTLNIFYGGDEWTLVHHHWCYRPAGCPETTDQVIAEIRASGADIVGMQEGTGNGCPIAMRLGWYCSRRLQVISRFPLIDPPGGGGVYIYAEVEPGRVVALANVHLPSDPYGPYLVRDGGSLADVLDLENTVRLPAIQPQLSALPQLAGAGIPVYLTGDFNSPSHLDWTAAVAAVREDVRYPVVWPVSKALEDIGLRDSYREVYADPIANPGFTWTPPDTLESVPDEVFDRIDRVLSAGPTHTLDSQVVGEGGNPDVDIAIDPYPTDHRGVVSTFEVTPAVPPPFAAVAERRVFAGDRLSVLFHAGAGDDRIGVVPAGGGAGSAIASEPTGGATDGTVEFDTTSIAPGAYQAALLHGATVVSRSPFWLYARGTPTSVGTSKQVYTVGEPIDVWWDAAPGNKWDWLGIYKPGDGPEPLAAICTGGYCGNGHYLLYEYMNASITGATAFTSASAPGYLSWPLGPGNYQIRMLEDDGYRLLASSATFKIVHGS